MEIPPRTHVHHVQIAKVRATMIEKQEQVMLSGVVVMKSRIQTLIVDLEAVKSSEMVAEKQFSSISTMYEWIASTIQNS